MSQKALSMDTVRFSGNVMDSVETLMFINNGKEYVNEEYQLICGYRELTKEYPFINFRTQSQIYLILCKQSIIDDGNRADVVQYIGMLAQEVCIENAQEDVYNRPIKQVMHTFWKPILKQNTDLDDYFPFYGVITGKDSVYKAVYKESF